MQHYFHAFDMPALHRLQVAVFVESNISTLRSQLLSYGCAISSLMHLVSKYHAARSRSKLRDLRWIDDMDCARYMIHDECYWIWYQYWIWSYLVWMLFRGVLWMKSSWTHKHMELILPKRWNCLCSHVVDRKHSVVEWKGCQMETGVPLRRCWKCITNPESCRMLFDFVK